VAAQKAGPAGRDALTGLAGEAVTGLPWPRPGGRLKTMASPHSHNHAHHEHDAACDVANGLAEAPAQDKVLVAVFATPVARFLLHFGADLGYRTVLVEPDPELAAAGDGHGAQLVTAMNGIAGSTADVVVTDHHREELGVQLRDALASNARWVGIMGNPRHEAPHLKALADLGVPAEQVARVHRPIGLNIGSHTPAEIAIATLAGLIADRNGKPGGFGF
jgi:xanthine dehydrogenase accessory factor